MQIYTLLLLTALAAIACSTPVDDAQNTLYSENDSLFGSATNSDNVRSPRTKRGLLLLKKKLLLGALGLKAVKIGAVGLGIAGALALKSKAASYGSSQSSNSYGASASYGYGSW